jgi:hypothetical protein
MKTLYESLLADIETSLSKGAEVMEDVIRAEIDKIYKCKKNTKFEFLPGDGPKVIVNAVGHVSIKPQARNITTLEHEMFEWGTVEGEFNIWKCANLTDLKGAPKVVDGCFNANMCSGLTSLEGAPERTKDFCCIGASSLKTLKGAPKHVMGDFYCSRNYSLTSLEGAPKYISGDFWLAQCDSLGTLEHMPIEIGGNLDCTGCKKLKHIVDTPKKIYGKCYMPSTVYDEAVKKLEPVCIKPHSFSTKEDERIIKADK